MQYEKIEWLLYNYKFIKIRVKTLEIELEKNYSTCVLFSSKLDGMPRGGGISNPTERIVSDISEKKAKIEHKLAKDTYHISIIENALKSLNNAEYKTIESRYIHNASWYVVSMNTGYSISQCKRYKKTAMEKLEKILKDI